MKRIAITICLLSCAAAAYAGEAAAGGRTADLPRAGVLVLAGKDKAAAALQQAAVNAFLGYAGGRNPAWKAVLFSAVADYGDEQERLRRFYDLAKEAKQKYRFLELEKASELFAKAQALLDEQPPAKCDPAMLAEFYYYWGRTELDAGHEEKARSLLARVVDFNPAAGPDPATMPPKLVAAFDIALEQRNAAEAAEIVFAPSGGPVEVYKDCRKVPLSQPLALKVGHRVFLVLDGAWKRLRLQLEVPAGGRYELGVAVPKGQELASLDGYVASLAEEPIAIGTLKAGRDERLDSIAAILGVDALALFVHESDGAAYAMAGLYVAGKGIVGEVQRVDFSGGRPEASSLAVAMDALSRSSRSPAAIAAVEASKRLVSASRQAAAGEQTRKVAAATPWWKTWWFWTAVGVAVAGGVATGVVLATTGSNPNAGKVVISVTPP